MKTFKELAVGESFHMNGNDYIKKNTRMALLVQYDRLFYFPQNCVIITLSNKE